MFAVGLVSLLAVLLYLDGLLPGRNHPPLPFDEAVWAEVQDYGDLRRFRMLAEVRESIAHPGASRESVKEALGPGRRPRHGDRNQLVYWLGIVEWFDSWFLHVHFDETGRVSKTTTHKY